MTHAPAVPALAYTWLRSPEPSWHLYGPDGLSPCELWQVDWAQPPPETIARVWNHEDIVCKSCFRRGKSLTAGAEAWQKGAVTLTPEND